jgi:hypothetical protein
MILRDIPWEEDIRTIALRWLDNPCRNVEVVKPRRWGKTSLIVEMHWKSGAPILTENHRLAECIVRNFGVESKNVVPKGVFPMWVCGMTLPLLLIDEVEEDVTSYCPLTRCFWIHT